MIDRSSLIPFYAQLKEEILERIHSGVWKPGDQLPSEAELCDGFSVSRTVVRQALNDLEYEGRIRKEKGRGSFVAQPKITERLAQELTGFHADMYLQGLELTNHVLRQAVALASGDVATALAVETGDRVVEIERLRFVRNEPLVLVTTYLPEAFCPGLEQLDLSHSSLYEILLDTYHLEIVRGRRVMEAVGASLREAELLRVPTGTPLMKLESISFLEDGKPIEYYTAFHRGDRSRFTVELFRERIYKKGGPE